MRGFHLAQVNVARLAAPLDSPQLAGFVANLQPINAIADASPGFVWRLQTEAGDATALRILDDDWLIVNCRCGNRSRRSGTTSIDRRMPTCCVDDRSGSSGCSNITSRCGGSRRGRSQR